MRRIERLALALVLLVMGITAAMALPQGRDSQPQTRTLAGQVMGQKDVPLPQAIVYLKNTKTLAVRTFIADANANYTFNALSPNVDYEVYAEYDGKKSDTKTLSSFDNRSKAYINLKIDTGKK